VGLLGWRDNTHVRTSPEQWPDLTASTVEHNDLAQAITALGQEFAAEASSHTSAGLQVDVGGILRTLHSIVRDEIYRIASEALRNAFRHAEAKQIEVELRYDGRQLRLRIRDDGQGIDPNFLTTEGVPDISGSVACASAPS
jgi:signal transduction histidine kinase